MNPVRLGHIDIFRALYSFGRDLKCPGKDQRNRKPDDDEHDYQTNDPSRNVEDWKNLSDSLRQRPPTDCVRDCDLIDVPPLQLAEETSRIDPGILRHTAYSSDVDCRATASVVR